MSTTSFSVNWELDSLYAHPETEAFRSGLARFEQDLRRLASDSEGLPQDLVDGAAVWGGFLERCGAVFAQYEDLQTFVGCHAAAEASNKEFRRLEGVLSSLVPLREAVLTNLELACRDVDDATFEEFVRAEEGVARVAFFVRECRRNAAFRLPRDEELLAAELDVDGRSAWSRLYDRLSGELRIEVMERGEVVRKSPGQVSFDSPERSVRENSFYAAERAWHSLADVCADALNHICGSRLTRYRRLGVRDHLELPLRLNRMERTTLETMWQVVAERRPVLTRYLSAKAKLLGLERLCWYDLAAPLPNGGGAAGPLTYDEACHCVLHTFGGFSDDLGEFARMALVNRWIEVENRPGKRQGGFCAGLPTKGESRIFMTFTNSDDSMSTLAHELGHAYHSHVLRDEPPLLRDYPMNLAETASTFAEAVLADQRMKQADDVQRLSLLDVMLGDSVAFLMNIHARFLFEDRFHRERAGGEVSAARLSELMRAAQEEAYCGALDERGWYPEFWVSKMHFYMGGWPFYNFPYTFGYLLSLGIHRLSGELADFPDQMRRFLVATGCARTEEAVARAFGVDLRRPDFWHQCLDVIDARVEQFCRLAGCATEGEASVARSAQSL
jgi:pepF/M3 family oligoendopeptidase